MRQGIRRDGTNLSYRMLVHDASIGRDAIVKSVSVEDRPVCFQVTACNQFSFSRSGGRESYDGLSS